MTLVDWKDSKTEKGIEVLELSGDIDLKNSPELREVLQKKAATKTEKLMLDFSGVKYIDSSGLATLIEYFQATRKFKGRVALFGMSDRVRSVFELVRLGEVFTILKTREEAEQDLNE